MLFNIFASFFFRVRFARRILNAFELIMHAHTVAQRAITEQSINLFMILIMAQITFNPFHCWFGQGFILETRHLNSHRHTPSNWPNNEAKWKKRPKHESRQEKKPVFIQITQCLSIDFEWLSAVTLPSIMIRIGFWWATKKKRRFMRFFFC